MVPVPGSAYAAADRLRAAATDVRDVPRPAAAQRAGHRKRSTPVRLTLLLGVFCATIAGLLPIDIVVELVNIGALSAFAVVCVGVLVLRKLEPNRERPFRTPIVPLVPIFASIGCILPATTLDALTWVRFAVWVAVGSAVTWATVVNARHWPNRSPPPRWCRPNGSGRSFGNWDLARIRCDRPRFIAYDQGFRHALWHEHGHPPSGPYGKDNEPYVR
jgi:amino acid transporter